jgi:hypothetical protein
MLVRVGESLSESASNEPDDFGNGLGKVLA